MSYLSAGHPLLAARLSEALASVLSEYSAREVGRWLGIKGDTVIARGRAVRAWDICDLMTIGEHWAPVRDAVRVYVMGESVPVGQAVTVVGDLLKDLSASGTFTAKAVTALADGRVSVDEAEELLIDLHKRRELEDLTLIPSLNACVQQG
jgi:hypothetical protein